MSEVSTFRLYLLRAMYVFTGVGFAIEKLPATAPIEIEATSPVQPRTSSAPLSVGIATAFERYLEMPVAFVLGVMWLAGAALMGSCALVLYLAVAALI